MKRRLLSLIVVLAILLSIFPVAAFAAAGDHHVEIRVSKAPINYKGKPAMEVAFWIKTGTTEINAIQVANIAVDLMRFDILNPESGLNANTDTLVESVPKFFVSGFAYTEYKKDVSNAVIGGVAYCKKGNLCVIGLMPDWRGGFGNAFPKSAKLMSILLGLKEGVTWDNLPEGCIRFATAAESDALASSAVVSINEDGQDWHWRPTGSASNLLTNEPKFTVDGFTFSETTPAQNSPGEQTAAVDDIPEPKTSVTPDIPTPQTFTDVRESDWFSEEVAFVVEKGIMQGIGNNRFAPNASATRSMLITMLHRLEGSPGVATASSFSDVEKGSWYDAAVRWATENDITSGISASKFGPDMEITREQLVTMLYRYAQKKGYVKPANTTLDQYSDKGSVSAWAKDAVIWAKDNGIITGVSDNMLDPKGTAKRAQIAAIFMRFVENVKNR